MQWKAVMYYEDPANNQIYDLTTFISEMDIYDLLSSVDYNILDHLKFVELKPIE